ncbi:MAG: hypothetical protein ACREOB_06775 [Thermodesulfobacteriota bacterium]
MSIPTSIATGIKNTHMSILTCTAMNIPMSIRTNTHMAKTPMLITMTIQKSTVLTNMDIQLIKLKSTGIPIKLSIFWSGY